MKYEIFSSKYVGIEPELVNKKFEKLDMKMQEGYGYELGGDAHKAVICWKIVFDEIKAYFDGNHLSELKTFDEIFNGMQFVCNWVQDYDNSLRKVLLDFDQASKQEIGMQRIDLLKFLLSLNLLEEMTVHNYKRSLAETYYRMGQPEVGEKHFIQLIEDYPDNAWGYIGYSDEYWMDYSKHKDYDKAMGILDKAYNRMTIKESDILAERITDLMITMKKKELENFLEMEKELVVSDDITLLDAINYLGQGFEDIPFSYLEFLDANRKEAEPVILEEMKFYLKEPNNYAKGNGLLSIYLPFILGQWERKESSKDVIELIACSEESINIRIGYSITEEYPVVLYKCFDGDLEYLKSTIGRENVGTFLKVAYLRALSMYYVENLKDIEGLKAYLEKLLKEQPELATWISDIVLMYHLDELLSLGEKAVKSKCYDPRVIENFRDWAQFSEERPQVPDFIALYQKLYNLREKKLGNYGKKIESNTEYYQKTLVKGKKIGRNEPCPCGSGKKYKKCCGK